MKTTKSGTNEKEKEKKQISRQTVNRVKVSFYAVFLVSNLFSLYVENMPVHDLKSSALQVVMAFINCVIVFIACGLIFLEIHLDKSPRVEKKDELYMQNEQRAFKTAITGTFILLLVIGVAADMLSKGFGLVDEIRIPVNSSTCLAAYAVIGLLMSVSLLIAERSSKSADADDEE